MHITWIGGVRLNNSLLLQTQSPQEIAKQPITLAKVRTVRKAQTCLNFYIILF